jgi:F-type H+-transporting ATPase subunit b
MPRVAARLAGFAASALLAATAALPALAEEAKKGGMPQLDQSTYPTQLVWLAITFIVLYVLMSRVALPRLGSVLEARQGKIAGDLGAAERLKGEAEAASAAYEAAMVKARAEAQAIAAKLREQSVGEAASRRAALDAEMAQKSHAAEAAVGAAKQAALANLQSVAVETSRSVVARLLGSEVSAAAAEAAVGAALRERK